MNKKEQLIEKYAEDLNFEKAADLRDKIEILEKKILGINEKI